VRSDQAIARKFITGRFIITSRKIISTRGRNTSSKYLRLWLFTLYVSIITGIKLAHPGAKFVVLKGDDVPGARVCISVAVGIV
jgi:hypothetical protein